VSPTSDPAPPGSRQGTVDHALVDLDGTVYRGGELVPGADEAVERMRQAGVEVTFLTNNAAAAPAQVAEKLSALGVSARPESVVTSGTITASHLAATRPEATLFVVGEDPFRRVLDTAGLTVTDEPTDADTVVVSLDRAFDYDTLATTLRVFETGDPRYVATNPDRTRPGKRYPQPSTGAIIGAIEGATGRRPDRVLGKPAVVAADVLERERDVDPDRAVVVGDRVETDVRFGNRLGARTALVLTGATDDEGAVSAAEGPDDVVDSLAALPPALPGV
jgi:HAD superfamily hydrolase (TIGR01450 family)